MSSATDQTIAPILDELCARYTEDYGVHTVVLYGSRARGQESANSDIDIAAFGPAQTVVREAFTSNGLFVDTFIYPEPCLEAPDQEHLKLRDSKILIDLQGRAAAFIAQLNALYAKGPEPLSEGEKQARRTWAGKMLQRIAGSDIDANYRRAWLLTDMLEDYFALRGLWYEGPGKSLRWIKEHEPEVYGAIEGALDHNADRELIRKAVELVYELRRGD